MKLNVSNKLCISKYMYNSDSKQLYFKINSNKIKSATGHMVSQSAFRKSHSLNLYRHEIFYIDSLL